MIQRIIKQLQKSNRILLASHVNPDGDAIGSLLALGLALGALGKQVTLYNESSIPVVYRFLPAVDRIVRHLPRDTAYDSLVVLDCGDLKRIGDDAVMVAHRIPVIINIDHHTTNTRFGHLHYLDTSACATAEILHRLIKEMAAPIDLAAATAIYTGILTDTGSFRFSNTNRAAFEICEEMVSLGVDPYHVAQHVYGTYSLSRIKLLNRALDSIEIAPNGRLSLMALTQEMLKQTGTKMEDADGLINYAKGIEDVKVAALIQEQPNGSIVPHETKAFHVSLRSDGTVDVAKIAGSFGGGGHSSAAGFSVETTLADLKALIYNIAETLENTK